MIKRMARVLKFDGSAYEEVLESDTATLEALAVVLLGGISIAMGLVLGVAAENNLEGRGLILLRSLSAAIAGWMAVSLLALGIGRLVRRKTTLTQTLRTVGYANAPAVFTIVILVASINQSLALIFNALILIWVMLAVSQAVSRTIDMPFSVGLWAGIVGMFLMLAIRNIFISALL